MMLTIKVKFSPGHIVATPNAMRRIKDPDYAMGALAQHLQGKWGTIDSEDWDANDKALRNGGRLLSSYPLPDDVGSFWILTEADRSSTTILMPEDY